MTEQAKPGNKTGYRPKPLRPDDAECCHRGCEPCIFDYYHQALARWYAEVKDKTRQGNSYP